MGVFTSENLHVHIHSTALVERPAPCRAAVDRPEGSATFPPPPGCLIQEGKLRPRDRSSDRQVSLAELGFRTQTLKRRRAPELQERFPSGEPVKILRTPAGPARTGGSRGTAPRERPAPARWSHPAAAARGGAGQARALVRSMLAAQHESGARIEARRAADLTQARWPSGKASVS